MFSRSIILCLVFLLFTPVLVISIASVKSQPSPETTVGSQALTASNEQTSIEGWNKVFDTLAKIFQIVAIAGGGVWAYYKFIKGRVYRPRLKLSVHGNSLITKEQRLLLVSLTIENVGLSVVRLQKKSMLVRVLIPEASNAGSKIQKVDGKHIGTFRVFQQHEWIESNEAIGDELTLSIPLTHEAVILQFRAVGSIKSFFRSQRLEW
jgi:hypothetical protein